MRNPRRFIRILMLEQTVEHHLAHCSRLQLLDLPQHARGAVRATTQLCGAWIFFSHSHRDLEKVRRIRNELERRGHNPLLFFLKCLEADDARLPELIRDEIKARTFFVLCNTRASRRSKMSEAGN